MAGTEPYGDAEAAFAAAVRNTRAQLRLTQEEVRQRLLDNFGIDLSKTAMSRLEQGERPIRYNEVVALAKVLRLNVITRGRRPETEELDQFLAESTIRLQAVEAELAIASERAKAARAALEDAEARFGELRNRHAELIHVQTQLRKSFFEAANARERLEMMKQADGDR